MLRVTQLGLNYSHKVEFWRARPLLRGRAKFERSLGVRAVSLRLQKYTRFRIHHRRYDQRARIRSNVDAAAVEHGTGWPHLKNDLARQNISVLPSTQKLLAQFEPLAFRSVLELCSSQIAPPLSVLHLQPAIPVKELALLTPDTEIVKKSLPTADLQLKDHILSMLEADNRLAALSVIPSALSKIKIGGKATTSAADWQESWKDFQVVDINKRVQPRL